MKTTPDGGSFREAFRNGVVVFGFLLNVIGYSYSTFAGEPGISSANSEDSVLVADPIVGSFAQTYSVQSSLPSAPPAVSRNFDWITIPENNFRWNQSANSYPTFRLRGRLETDLLSPNQSGGNETTFGDLSDTVGFRRARIGAEGNISSDSRYIAEIDLASGTVVLRDFYVGLGDVRDGGDFKIGHMREPFSLEGGTSANSFAFMERSLINELDPARNWGVSYSRCSESEMATSVVGIFQSGTDASDFQYNSGSTTAATARWTRLSRYENEGKEFIHFGLALSERIPDQGIIIVNQSSSSPLLNFGDSTSSTFLPTLKIAANFQQLGNLQFAASNGPIWSQAEWYGSLIDQNGGRPVFYHGGYIDIGHFITGEHRKYLTRTGVLGPVMINRPAVSGFTSKPQVSSLGFGAWELTARTSYLDFNDSNAPIGPQGQTFGSRVSQSTVGLNWYLAEQLRVMLNYTYTIPVEANTGSSSSSTLGMRFAVFW